MQHSNGPSGWRREQQSHAASRERRRRLRRGGRGSRGRHLCVDRRAARRRLRPLRRAAGTARGDRGDHRAPLVAGGDALRRGGGARRREGDRRSRHRSRRDRDAHLHLGVPASPRAVGRVRRPSSPRPAPGCLNFDLGNACLGFVNAIHLAATAIDAGQIRYALIVDGEGARHTQLTTIARLQAEARVTADVYDEFASLTLGSGSAAMVLGSLDSEPAGASYRRRHLARGDAAPRDLRRRPRADEDRHEGAARGAGSSWPTRPGPSRRRISAGRRASPGTSSIRSARCTRASCARRSASTSPGRR